MLGLAFPFSVTQPLIKSYLISGNSIVQHNQVRVYMVKMNTSIRNNHDFIETLLGGAKYFNKSQLPTIANVLRACSMRRKELMNGSLEPKWTDIRNYVSKRVMEIWHKASLPIKSEKCVLMMLEHQHEKLIKVRKVPISMQKK